MIYKAYARDNRIQDDVIVETCKAKNKAEMRQLVLDSPRMRTFTKVHYGKKCYSMSDIYAGR